MWELEDVPLSLPISDANVLYTLVLNPSMMMGGKNGAMKSGEGWFEGLDGPSLSFSGAVARLTKSKSIPNVCRASEVEISKSTAAIYCPS